MLESRMSLKSQTADEAAQAKERVALGSIAASALITLAKGAAGLATGSLALISDAAHSLLDVVATTMTWFAVRAANKPADEEHHYGHGKFESLAAFVETAFLFLLSGAVAFEGVRRLLVGASGVEASWAAAGVLVAAIVVDAWRWRQLKRVAAETGSEALEADALHFSSDLVNSVLVLGALGAAALGYPQADALVAVLVALFIAVAGFRLAQRTLGTLLDAAPRGLAERVKVEAERVAGVVSVERVRLRPAGGQVFGELLVRVSRTLPLESVVAIKRKIGEALAAELPGSEVTVTAEPAALDDETLLERVMLIAARRRVLVHHVIVQNISGQLGISLDVEVDGRMSLGAAHQKADRLEAAIREELGPDIEVDTHIEPLRVSQLEGADETGGIAARIARGLAEIAEQVGAIKDVHSVRVRRTEDGLVVNYHCRVDPALTVATVHDHVDELERRVRLEHPDILRVIGHAEPMRA
jgi:cation diffusion facilitator family transporter